MKNGYDFERAKKIAEQIQQLLSGPSSLQQAQERRDQIQKILDDYILAKLDQPQQPYVDIVCDFCFKSRGVDEFIDFYDPETNKTAIDLPQFEERTIEEQDVFKKRCFHKVKLQCKLSLHLIDYIFSYLSPAYCMADT